MVDAAAVGTIGDQEADHAAGGEHEQPQQDQLAGRGQARRTQHQSKHDAAQAEVVDLRQRVQSCVDVGKTKQADRSRADEPGANDQQQRTGQLKRRHRRLPVHFAGHIGRMRRQ